jgi:hypothetical protein
MPSPHSASKKEAFLAHLGVSGNISAAASAAGVDRKTPYNWREADPAFAAAWDAQCEAGLDELEREAARRALDSSDTLLIFLLKSKRRGVFGEKREVELTGANGGPIVVAEVPLDAERAEAVAAILKSTGAAG